MWLQTMFAYLDSIQSFKAALYWSADRPQPRREWTSEFPITCRRQQAMYIYYHSMVVEALRRFVLSPCVSSSRSTSNTSLQLGRDSNSRGRLISVRATCPRTCGKINSVCQSWLLHGIVTTEIKPSLSPPTASCALWICFSWPPSAIECDLWFLSM